MACFLGNGIHLNGISIDPNKKTKAPKNAVITHAHSDHVCLNKHTEFLLSKETKDLVQERHGKIHNHKIVAKEKKHEIGESTLSFFDSGHILGSVQAVVENHDKTVYTSDFRLSDSLLLKGAIPLQADTLVIESTFGLPSYNFPNRQELYSTMEKWIKQKAEKGFVVLAGYSIGKAQELTKLVNEHTAFTPIVHESIYKINKVYEKHGKKLGDYFLLDHNLKDSSVLVLPPSLANPGLFQAIEYSTKKKVFSAMATGWEYKGHFDEVFPLSDHADFRQLMQYVQYSQPKQVFTTHGFERELAGYIKKRLGIEARPLSQANQKTIREFSL